MAIIHSIYNEVDNNESIIRVPIHVRVRLRKLGRAYDEYVAKHSSNPSVQDLETMTGIKAEHIEEAWLKGRQPISLDKYVGKDEDEEWQPRYDVAVDPIANTLEDEVIQRDLKELLRDLLEELPYRERRVLEFRYGLWGETKLTLDDTGRKFNLTRERIRQIENQAIKRLQRRAASTGLSGERWTSESITPETVRWRHELALGRMGARTFVDSLALEARAFTQRQERQRALTEQQRAEAVQRAREEAVVAERLAEEQAQLDEQYERLMIDRSMGTVDEASGRLPLRTEYFRSKGVPPRQLSSGRPTFYWEPDFKQLYGNYATGVAGTLYKGLQALTTKSGKVTLSKLLDYIEEYDDSLFDVRSEFLAAVLEAQAERGVVKVERQRDEPVAYRLRRPNDPLPVVLKSRSHAERTTLPPYAKNLLERLESLGIGQSPETAITFGMVRRSWSENTLDVNETALRMGMTYLIKAGLINADKDRIRGSYIWREQNSLQLRPIVKPSDLWYEDLNS